MYHGCQNLCEATNCGWECSKPTNCPQPKCELMCEQPTCRAANAMGIALLILLLI